VEVYEELRQHLDKHAAGAPESPEIIEILSSLFTPEEAKVAVATPFRPATVKEIAERARVSEEEAKTRLESMADKGLVYAREKDGEWGYALLPVMPGIFEFPYMKGVKDDKLECLSRLWEEYLIKHAKEMGKIGTPFARVIPLGEAVESDPAVLTYEKVYELIERAKVVGLAHCACRTAFSHCDRPREACMVFDDTCRYLVERGFARYLTKEEMKEKLKEFDRMGLVHTVNNSQDKLQFICNCCTCCCGFLRGVKEFKIPNFLASSGFIAKIDEELCSGCEVCVERCQMDAISIVDGVAFVDEKRCIGCGLCVTGCDTNAASLIRSEEKPEVPKTIREMAAKILDARGKLADFIEINR